MRKFLVNSILKETLKYLDLPCTGNCANLPPPDKVKMMKLLVLAAFWVVEILLVNKAFFEIWKAVPNRQDKIDPSAWVCLSLAVVLFFCYIYMNIRNHFKKK